METTIQKENIHDNKSSDIVAKAYKLRKKTFLDSLLSILKQIPEDKIVRQMLADKTSGQFITRRVEELVEQIICDEREQYIDSLIEQLHQSHQNNHKAESQKVLKLGAKILSLSDAQNSAELYDVRRIQALQEQVKSLQDELITLKTSKLEDIKVDEIYSTNISRPNVNPSSPIFMHIFASVDVTDYANHIRQIQTDSQALKKMMMMMLKKTHQIFTLSKKKTFETIKKYEKLIPLYQQKMEEESNKIADIQKHYEEEVIPNLINLQKESVQKHKQIDQNRIQEIQSLRSQMQLQESSNQVKQNELQSQVDDLTVKLQRSEQQLQTISNENQSKTEKLKKAEIEKQELQQKFLKFKSEFSMLKDQNIELISNLNEAQSNLQKVSNELVSISHSKDISEKNNSSKILEIENHLTTAKNEISQLKQMITKKDQEISFYKDEESKNQIKEMEFIEKINSLENSNSKIRDSESILKQQVNQLQQENEDQLKKSHSTETNYKEQISRLQKDLNDARLQEEKLNNTIESLKSKLQDQTIKIQASSNSNENLSHELNDIRSQFECLKSQNENQNQKIKQLMTENGNLSNQVEILESANKDQNLELMNQARDMKSNIDKLIQEKENLEKVLVDMESQNNAKSAYIEQQSTQIKHLDDKIILIQKKMSEEADQSGSLIHQQQEKMQLITNENSSLKLENAELNEKIKYLTSNINKKELTIEKLQTKENDINQALNKSNAYVSISSIQELPLLVEKMKQIEQERDNILSALGSNSEQSGELIQQLQAKALIVDVLQKSMKAESINDVPKLFSKMKNERNELLNALGTEYDKAKSVISKMKEKGLVIDALQNHLKVNSYDEVIEKVKNLQDSEKERDNMLQDLHTTPDKQSIAIQSLIQKGKILDNVKNSLGCHSEDSILKLILQIQNDRKMNDSTMNEIRKLLKLDESNDIIQEIAKYNDTNDQIKKSLSEASVFVNEIIDIIISPSSLAKNKINFPMKKELHEKVIEILTQFKEKINDDRTKISHILAKIQSIGYRKNDIEEGFDFYINYISEKNNQKAFEEFQNKFKDITESLDKEIQAHKQDKEKNKKRIRDLQSQIVSQQENAQHEREDLNEQINSLKALVNQLKNDLEIERALREELGRIGAGASANNELLRSKLSANELKFVNFYQEWYQRQLTSQDLLEKQKQLRENLLQETSGLNPKSVKLL